MQRRKIIKMRKIKENRDLEAYQLSKMKNIAVDLVKDFFKKMRA